MVTGSTSTMTNENYKGDVCTNIQAVYLTVELDLGTRRDVPGLYPGTTRQDVPGLFGESPGTSRD